MNQFAREIYQDYYKRGHMVFNQYCQIKSRRPLEALPELSKEIWRLQTLIVFWGVIANCYGEKQNEA